MMEDFQIGDVVQLKSGGPEMTVENVGKDMYETEKVWCSWFVGSEKKTETFSPQALAKVGD